MKRPLFWRLSKLNSMQRLNNVIKKFILRRRKKVNGFFTRLLTIRIIWCEFGYTSDPTTRHSAIIPKAFYVQNRLPSARPTSFYLYQSVLDVSFRNREKSEKQTLADVLSEAQTKRSTVLFQGYVFIWLQLDEKLCLLSRFPHRLMGSGSTLRMLCLSIMNFSFWVCSTNSFEDNADIGGPSLISSGYVGTQVLHFDYLFQLCDLRRITCSKMQLRR